MRDCNDQAKDVAVFIGGALIGAGVALLFAPQSGKRTRQEIQRLGKTVLKRADRFTGDIQDSLSNLMEEVSSVSKQAVDAGRDISNKTREEVLEILESGRKFIEEEKRRWEKTLRG